ncbi:MAG: prepilin peptidase [Actinobacteria bacterium]|nr:prepilin peptidase [Actinomycetota bacterium]
MTAITPGDHSRHDSPDCSTAESSWPTVDRVRRSWRQAHVVSRLALIAACVVSLILPMAVVRANPFSQTASALSGVVLAAAALVDAYEFRLPNRLLAVALAAAFTVPLVALDSRSLGRALLGMFLGGGLVLLVHLSRGVGVGDVKMAAAVGASLGGVTGSSVVAAPIAIAIAAFAASAYGLLARRQRVAMGPSLWAGWASALALTSLGGS